MKKNIFPGLFLVLTVLAGLLLSGCQEVEAGIGVIKLVNNSTNVSIGYWSLEKGGKPPVWETRSYILPGRSASHETDTGFYTVYLEESNGDGWITKRTHIVKKEQTVEVKFPTDFDPSN